MPVERTWTALAGLALLVAPAVGPTGGRLEVERARLLMGTTCRVLVVADDQATAEGALEAAFAAIQDAERLLSTWRADSDLFRLNAGPAGEARPVSAELATALAAALELARATGGAFDPTVGALVDAWDLRGAGRVPAAAQLDAALAEVGHEHVVVDVDAATVRVGRPGLWIDSGAFGKGLALDRAAAALRRHGVRSALLDFGGQLLAVGPAPDGGPWRVALADPRDRERPAVVVELPGGSLATSSQGERFVEPGGRRAGHVLDPRTGLPLEAAGSATAWAPTALAADALSTALLVAGPEGAARWAGRPGTFQALFVRPAGAGLEAIATPGLLAWVAAADPSVHVRSWDAALPGAPPWPHANSPGRSSPAVIAPRHAGALP